MLLKPLQSCNHAKQKNFYGFLRTDSVEAFYAISLSSISDAVATDQSDGVVVSADAADLGLCH